MPKPYEQPRFVGFVDVLGYKAIVRDLPLTDPERFHYLHSLFTALAQSARDITSDFGGPPTIRSIQFSDCFYFSSTSAVTLVAAIANFFANVFTIYDHSIQAPTTEDGVGQFPEWLPFLRGGIVRGWLFEGLDITIPALQTPAAAFRNPIGPAVANAYLISEETEIDGMRLIVSEEVRHYFNIELPTINSISHLGLTAAPLTPLPLGRSDTFPDFGEIGEVPWFESRLQTDNTVGTFDTLIVAERQFYGGMKHYRATWDAILRVPGVVNNPTLMARAQSIRNDVVTRMAFANWEKRGMPALDDWHDWFKAEGRLPK